MLVSPLRRYFAAAAAVIAFVFAVWSVIVIFLFEIQLVGLPSAVETKTLCNDRQVVLFPVFETPMLRNQTGTWIGNNWVPPSGWRLFSAAEMLLLYQNKSVLWVGDSTTRRSALTLYGILQSPSDAIPASQIDGANIIDVNKRKVTEPCYRYGNNTEIPMTHCRLMPGNNSSIGTNEKLFSIYSSACIAELESFLRRELAENQYNALTLEYDLVVIGQGIWEAVRGHDCKRREEGNRTMKEVFNATLDLLEQFSETRPEVTIIWRTSGFHQDGINNDLIHYLNENAMGRIDQFATKSMQQGRPSNLVYINFGKAIANRSFGDDRIKGDIKPHYGLEARYTSLQMIANVVHTADTRNL